MHVRIFVGIAACLPLLAACSNEPVKGSAGKEYEVVAEGQATGVTPALGGTPQLTNTNADTTTAFTVVPTGTDGTAMAPMPPMIGTADYGTYPPTSTYTPPAYPPMSRPPAAARPTRPAQPNRPNDPRETPPRDEPREIGERPTPEYIGPPVQVEDEEDESEEPAPTQTNPPSTTTQPPTGTTGTPDGE